ncbi:unnamed protein product [Orchesella dallaii]|uniref:Uncharacterized protein n=1 Tax=Orchesella dallaii TaxID=48710 RepID=A0ABP1PRS8_9HEXA
MANRRNKFNVSSVPAPTNGVPLVPMITYANGTDGPQPTDQELTQQVPAADHYSMFGFAGPAEAQLAQLPNRGGVSMTFSGPVHVQVDNMYVYDGDQLRRAIDLTQRAYMFENGTLAQPAQPTAAPKAPRKRPPPKKKAPVSDAVPDTTTNGANGGDGSATPPHSE